MKLNAGVRVYSSQFVSTDSGKNSSVEHIDIRLANPRKEEHNKNEALNILPFYNRLYIAVCCITVRIQPLRTPMTAELSLLRNESPRSYRDEKAIQSMLQRLSGGHGTAPRRQECCIIFDIDKEPKNVDLKRDTDRIMDFKQFIDEYYWMDTDVVGIIDHCVRVFLRPVDYSRDLRKEVYERVNITLFQLRMKRFGVSRSFFYGKTLVVS
jgi:hypothetical protein